jgi:hypothetical protein
MAMTEGIGPQGLNGAGAPGAEQFTSLLGSGEREVIVIFVELAQTLGLSKSLGEIYGLLYAVPRPLPFQSIVELLHLSKGSVSQGLRFLRTVGAVKPVVVPRDRREYFEAETELKKLVGGFIRENIQPQLERWGQRNQSLVEPGAFTFAVAGDGQAEIRKRLKRMQGWQKRAAIVLPTMGKLLG